MKELYGKVAAITGAASGIGQALAIELAGNGCDLAISDKNEEGLQETQTLAESFGVRVITAQLDVSDRQAVHDWADQVVAHFGKVNLVFNNAGVALCETIENMSYENLEWVMNINFWGVVHGTKAFLPYLKQSGEGHVINISSIFGIVSIPTQSAYNAAKFAVRGFTECLREEMKIEGHNIQVSTVHPGGIKTNIMRSGRIGDVGKSGIQDQQKAIAFFDKVAKTTAKQAAKVIVNGVKKDKARILIGADAKMMDLLQRLMPARYQDIVIDRSASINRRQNSKK